LKLKNSLTFMSGDRQTAANECRKQHLPSACCGQLNVLAPFPPTFPTFSQPLSPTFFSSVCVSGVHKKSCLLLSVLLTGLVLQNKIAFKTSTIILSNNWFFSQQVLDWFKLYMRFISSQFSILMGFT